MNMAPLVLTALALCLELLGAADPVAAQDYPTQPIKIVVAATAGGPSASKTRNARGLRRLHRCPAQEMERGRQGGRRDDQLNGDLGGWSKTWTKHLSSSSAVDPSGWRSHASWAGGASRAR